MAVWGLDHGPAAPPYSLTKFGVKVRITSGCLSYMYDDVRKKLATLSGKVMWPQA